MSVTFQMSARAKANPVMARSKRPATFAATAFLFASIPNAVLAEDIQGRLARGGRLYDNWISELKAEKPATTHAAWPKSNTKKSGATTWRCKSCHGWDYMGKDGAYAKGSYQTGIVGIRKQAGGDEAKIASVITDKTHALSDKLGAQDVKDLALFVAKGQIDNDRFIDRATKAIKGGDAAKGAAYFNTVCANCHGTEGDQPSEMPDSLAKLIAANPWETLHKVMNGQPKEPMPALRAFDPKITSDILAYVATLPKKTAPKKK